MTTPSSTDSLIPARDDADVRTIGRAFIDKGIRDGASLFAPAIRAWDSFSVDELYRCYNQQPDESSDKFLDKLERQLDDASDEAILLAAELLTLQALPLSNLKPENKAARVRTVLSWMNQPVDLPKEVIAAFEQRSWNGGTGAHTMLWKWLADAVVLLRTRTQTDAAWDRQVADHPLRWRDWVREGGGMASLTEALLYLGFPNHFLPIINIEHKRKIAAAYRSELPGGRPIDDLDRDLLAITVSLQRKHNSQIDFYKHPFVDEWRTSTRPSGERRAWLIRPTSAGESEARHWNREGIVSIPGAYFGGLTPDADRATVRRVVENEYGHLDAAQQAALTVEVHAFWSMMRPEDLVVTIANNRLSAGTVNGPASYEAEPKTELRREVGWLTSKPIELVSSSLLN